MAKRTYYICAESASQWETFQLLKDYTFKSVEQVLEVLNNCFPDFGLLTEEEFNEVNSFEDPIPLYTTIEL